MHLEAFETIIEINPNYYETTRGFVSLALEGAVCMSKSSQDPVFPPRLAAVYKQMHL